MKLLILFRLEIVGGSTTPKHLVYAESLEKGRAMVEKLFGESYGTGKCKIRDSATQVFDDVITAENGIGPGCSILGTLHPGQQLEFLRDFSRSNTPRRHGSGLHKMLLDELKRQEGLEKKRLAEEKRKRIDESLRPTPDDPGRSLKDEERQAEETLV